MSNLTKIEFAALHISGINYLPWVLDTELHLEANSLQETIKTKNEASPQDRAKALIFLRHHLHEYLKSEYLTVKDPQILWTSLKERFDQQRTVILPKARYEWSHLRFQDFKFVTEYNSAVFKITSKLKLCGHEVSEEEILDKTYSTFHPDNIVLKELYRGCKYEKYSELISVLLVAEQNNKLLLKNHESRPTGSAPVPEAHANSFRGRGRGRGNRRGRGRHNSRGIDYNHPNNKCARSVPYYQKWNASDKGKWVQNNPSKYQESVCYRCGKPGHWSRVCRMPKRFEHHQTSNKEKGNNVEINFADQNEPTDSTHFDLSDFLVELEE